MQINWGIIGCGDVCEIKSGPAFNKVPNSKLEAVMRRDEQKAKDFAQRHHVARYYSNAQDLINDKDVNAIYIATPPSSHEEFVIAAIKAGKPVYVEKPVSINSASVEKMIKAANAYNVKVSVAHYRRNLPMFLRIKELIQTDVIGQPKIVLLKTMQPSNNKLVAKTSTNWRIDPAISGGGLFHDLAPHQLDIMYWLFGNSVYDHVKSINQGKLYNAADLTMVNLVFENEICFNGTWHFNMPESICEDSCEIIGEHASMEFPFFNGSTLTLTTANEKQVVKFTNPTNIQMPHIEKVVDYFRGEGENPCSLQEALTTMKIIENTCPEQEETFQ